MIVYVHADHGTAYAMDDGYLISTPLHQDLTYDTCWDNWIVVDEDHCEAEGIDTDRICRFILRCEDLEVVYADA